MLLLSWALTFNPTMHFRFDYFGWNVDSDIKVQYILDMFYELFGDAAASRSSTPSGAPGRLSTPSTTTEVLDLRLHGVDAAAKDESTETLRPTSRWASVNRRGSNCQQTSSKLHMDREQILHFLLTVGTRCCCCCVKCLLISLPLTFHRFAKTTITFLITV